MDSLIYPQSGYTIGSGNASCLKMPSPLSSPWEGLVQPPAPSIRGRCAESGNMSQLQWGCFAICPLEIRPSPVCFTKQMAIESRIANDCLGRHDLEMTGEILTPIEVNECFAGVHLEPIPSHLSPPVSRHYTLNLLLRGIVKLNSLKFAKRFQIQSWKADQRCKMLFIRNKKQ